MIGVFVPPLRIKPASLGFDPVIARSGTKKTTYETSAIVAEASGDASLRAHEPNEKVFVGIDPQINPPTTGTVSNLAETSDRIQNRSVRSLVNAETIPEQREARAGSAETLPSTHTAERRTMTNHASLRAPNGSGAAAPAVFGDFLLQESHPPEASSESKPQDSPLG